METADRVGDWSIPTENVVLANISPQTATNESQDLVEEAVRSLKGKDQGDQPKTEKPAQEASEPNVGDQQFTEAKTDRAESAQETIPNRSSNKENFETKPPKKEKPTSSTRGSGACGTNCTIWALRPGAQRLQTTGWPLLYVDLGRTLGGSF